MSVIGSLFPNPNRSIYLIFHLYFDPSHLPTFSLQKKKKKKEREGTPVSLILQI